MTVVTTRLVCGLLVALAIGGGCHREYDPTFDADEYLITAWSAAQAIAPDGVMLSLWVSHVDAQGRVHYADDGSLALTMLSPSQLGEGKGCKKLWQIVGGLAGEQPNHPTLNMVTEWRGGPCASTSIVTRPPRCLIRSIWDRAIADGALGDARATIKLLPLQPGDGQGAQIWSVEIPPTFSHLYPDDCGADHVRRADRP